MPTRLPTYENPAGDEEQEAEQYSAPSQPTFEEAMVEFLQRPWRQRPAG